KEYLSRYSYLGGYYRRCEPDRRSCEPSEGVPRDGATRWKQQCGTDDHATKEAWFGICRSVPTSGNASLDDPPDPPRPGRDPWLAGAELLAIAGILSAYGPGV